MSSGTLGARLTADIRLADGQLVVRYQLVNETREELCLFNKVYRTLASGARVLEEHFAYVFFEDPETLHITRSAVALPDGLKVEVIEVPYATVLAPARTIAETVRVPVPVRQASPYPQRLPAGTGKERRFEQVYFSLGVVPKAPDLKLRPLPRVGEGIFAVEYEDAMTRQCQIRSPMVRLRIPGTG